MEGISQYDAVVDQSNSIFIYVHHKANPNEVISGNLSEILFQHRVIDVILINKPKVKSYAEISIILGLAEVNGWRIYVLIQ